MSGDDEKLSEAELDRLIKGDTAHNNSSEQKDEDGKKKERIADKLIKIAIEKSYRESDSPPDAGGLFHTSDRVAYADIDILGWRETWPVRSRGFRYWLVRIYYETTGTAPNNEALHTALSLCEARAFFDGPQREVFTRIGGANGQIYIDLANERWQVIEISSTGWKVLDSKEVPVRFRRAPGMLPLPEPKVGGSIDDLRLFLNVKSDNDFELALAWPLAAMRDKGPYPVLALMGEQGSAKTSFATILRSLIDPSTAPLRSFPREDRDLFIAASNGWVVGYDNVSRIPSWLSDALCRLATGGGFSTRKLYTDDEEQLFNAQRPAVLNGIEDFVGRPDLADRTIFLTLEPIPEERRKADQALQDELNRARPKILGALLNLIVIGLQRLPRIRLERLPRMADFALWGTACERMPGAFMRGYEENRKSAVETILEADLVATAIQELMASRKEWKGNASQLLAALEEVVGEKAAKSKNWPASAEVLGRNLRRPATFLRKVGIEIGFKREGSARKITITRNRLADWVGEQPSQPSQPSQPEQGQSAGDDRGVDGGRDSWAGDASPDHASQDVDTSGESPPSHVSPHLSQAKPLKPNGNDSSDSSDGKIPTQSGEDPTQSGEDPICRRCGVSSSEMFGSLVPCGANGSAGLYHLRCWTEERTRPQRRHVSPDRRPALGPRGDSLDDLR